MNIDGYQFDSDLIVVDERLINRNYEQFICDRIDFNCQLTQVGNFKAILNGMKFTDKEITEEECTAFKEKWGVCKFKEDIKLFKSNIIELYDKKNKLETKFNTNKELYDKYCENTKNILEQLFSLPSSDNDFRNKFIEKTKEYREFLEIESLSEQVSEINKEFSFLKEIIASLCDFNPTICTICIENQIEYFINPCGHTLCEKCKLKWERNKTCHYCRTPRIDFKKLYLN